MHIPDGFIDGKTAAAAVVISLAGVGLALRQVRCELPARKVQNDRWGKNPIED